MTQTVKEQEDYWDVRLVTRYRPAPISENVATIMYFAVSPKVTGVAYPPAHAVAMSDTYLSIKKFAENYDLFVVTWTGRRVTV